MVVVDAKDSEVMLQSTTDLRVLVYPKNTSNNLITNTFRDAANIFHLKTMRKHSINKFH
ncbi:hypothetical protein SAMN04487996_110270 [Dyadobacter soli]|uniref:Uncharacterized protein n=1 Tax=Dyadobacter soli TaxID=659014 RepID=A0A1G7KZW8_9BACT|nr:hypothetical protein SAMN04487996_110270 [Dyadobacter soli]